MPPVARPLSPHLQVYRWQIQMVTSILHRASGIVLSVGAFVLAGMLLAMASGQEAWDCARGLLASWPGILVMIGFTWALCYHWLNGIRHLVQDAGWGFSIPAFVRSSWVSVIGSVVLTAIVCAVAICCGGVA